MGMIVHHPLIDCQCPGTGGCSTPEQCRALGQCGYIVALNTPRPIEMVRLSANDRWFCYVMVVMNLAIAALAIVRAIMVATAA